MLWRLILIFTVVPLTELYLLFRVAKATSFGATLLLVVTTGFIGSLLARSQGIAAWRRFQAAIAASRMPSVEIQEGLMIAFAAALLLTPGLLTDTLGFSLLIPKSRSMIRRFLAWRYRDHFALNVRVHRGSFPSFVDDSNVVDAQGVRNPGGNETKPDERRLP